jgi:uncharacterized membrane protein YcaP (DUF421 family)
VICVIGRRELSSMTLSYRSKRAQRERMTEAEWAIVEVNGSISFIKTN